MPRIVPSQTSSNSVSTAQTDAAPVNAAPKRLRPLPPARNGREAATQRAAELLAGARAAAKARGPKGF